MCTIIILILMLNLLLFAQVHCSTGTLEFLCVSQSQLYKNKKMIQLHNINNRTHKYLSMGP